MKATELRLGNWVNLQDKGAYQIDSGHDIDEVDSFDGSGIDYCTGIPLTEDWLLRFGFEKNTIEFGSNEKIELDYNGDGRYNVFYSQINIECLTDKILMSMMLAHVHQLQNLYFSLTGEELTAK